MLHGDHLVSHVTKPELREENVLHVIGVITNSHRIHSRLRLAREWLQRMVATPYVKVTLVEAAYGDRNHELKQICHELNVDFVPLRTHSCIWIKENMINIAYKHITVKYPGARYFAHIDCDVEFNCPSWALESLHQLQHYEVIQPWSDALDMGPHGEVLQHFKSFGYQHQRREPKQMHPGQTYYRYAHTGFGFCWTRKFYERVRGLMDFPILGSADHHMAFGMIGKIKDTIHGGNTKGFFDLCFEWERQAVAVTHKEVGFILGTIKHHFHGPKKRRYYRERWQILIDHKFDPKKDLMYDSQGVIQLLGKPALEHAIHQYHLSRHEDSIETT